VSAGSSDDSAVGSPRPTDSQAAVSCRGLSKDFGGPAVLDGIDLDIAAGERVAVIGPSGSGKTTLLRVIAGLERPSSGRVDIEGKTLWADDKKPRERDLRRVRRRIGYVFQQFNLFPHMTALSNVTEAPIHAFKVPRADAERRGEELLAHVGLAHRTGAYPSQLSGGQQQRVAIARALALDPSIMLFDEVTSALDPELVGEVLRVISDLAKETNMTMFFVSHHMSFARQVADRVIFMDGAKIVEQGRPDEIFVAPSEERTRVFLKTVLEFL
jgi:polar amino acid transport system ATP-binding protein